MLEDLQGPPAPSDSWVLGVWPPHQQYQHTNPGIGAAGKTDRGNTGRACSKFSKTLAVVIISLLVVV